MDTVPIIVSATFCGNRNISGSSYESAKWTPCGRRVPFVIWKPNGYFAYGQMEDAECKANRSVHYTGTRSWN